MSATTLDTIPFIDVTKSGVTRSLPVQIIQRAGQPDRAVPLSRTPKTGYPQPTSIGSDPAARRNYDIDEIIFADWSGGMGEDIYPPQTAPTSFQWSQCETRYHGVLACRPLATQLGSTITGLGTVSSNAVIHYVQSTPLIYVHQAGKKAYAYSGGAWSAAQDGAAADITGLMDVTPIPTGIIAVNGTLVYRDVAGGAPPWEATAVTGLTSPQLAEWFDEKAWVLDRTNPGTPNRYVYTLYSSANFASVAAASVTWTANAAFTISNANSPVPLDLFIWKDPNDSGRDTLWCMRDDGLLYLDYYAQTPAWVFWGRFGNPNPAAWRPLPWLRNGNLYAVAGQSDALTEWTGNTIDTIGPNARGGLPAGTKVMPTVLAQNSHHLFAFCINLTSDTNSLGGVLAMSEAKTFHHLYSRATICRGGGVYGDTLYAAFLDSDSAPTGVNVYSLNVPDDSGIPQHASGRTYDSAALTHKSAWIHGGFRNVWKNLRYVEVDCIKDNGDPGLNAGATVAVQVYNRKDHSTTTLATLTDASTFPAVCTTTGGIDFKECQIWLVLTRGTATSATPLIRAVKVGYRPRPKQRYTYAVRLDLRDEAPAFGTPGGQFKGYSASSLRTWLDELNDSDDAGLPDALVTLAYGGEGWSTHPRRRSIADCEVLVTAQEDAEGGDGIYLVQFNDVSAPASG